MKKLKYLVMDVDGTMTNGKIYMGKNGEVMKAFDVKDGYAISHLLIQHDIVPIVITGRVSDIVEQRCNELGVFEVHQGCQNKKDILLDIIDKYGEINNNSILLGCAYIGDDLTDIPAMLISELSGCPADACDEVKKIVTYVCKKNGGEGAIREFIEWLLKRID